MGTHPIFESDFDCLAERKKLIAQHGYDGASSRACKGLPKGCCSVCPSINQTRQERVPEDCLCNRCWFFDHGLHWILCQADPHSHQQHYRRFFFSLCSLLFQNSVHIYPKLKHQVDLTVVTSIAISAVSSIASIISSIASVSIVWFRPM